MSDDEKTLIVYNDDEPKPVEPAPSPLLSEPAPAPEAVAAAPVIEEPAQDKKKKGKKEKVLTPSRFDGNAIHYFFLALGCVLLTVVTLGIMFPWCLCWMASFKASHTIVDEKRLAFDGKGGELIGKWLLYIVLYIVTATIFGLWIPKKIQNWKQAHLHFAPVDEAVEPVAPTEAVAQ
jgi:hypothetical protein